MADEKFDALPPNTKKTAAKPKESSPVDSHNNAKKNNSVNANQSNANHAKNAKNVKSNNVNGGNNRPRQNQNQRQNQKQNQNTGNPKKNNNARNPSNATNPNSRNRARGWLGYNDEEVNRIKSLPVRSIRTGTSEERMRGHFDQRVNKIYFFNGQVAEVEFPDEPKNKPVPQSQPTAQTAQTAQTAPTKKNVSTSDSENEQGQEQKKKRLFGFGKAKTKESRENEDDEQGQHSTAVDDTALKGNENALMVQQTRELQEKSERIQELERRLEFAEINGGIKNSTGKKIGKVFTVLLAVASVFACGFIVAMFYGGEMSFTTNGDTSSAEKTQLEQNTTDSIVSDTIEVVQLVKDVIQGEVITADMLQAASISMESYNQITLNGTNIYLWDRSENLVGMYSTSYIPKGQYVSYDSISLNYDPPKNVWGFSGGGVSYEDIPLTSSIKSQFDDSDFYSGKKFKVTIQKKTVIETPSSLEGATAPNSSVEQSIRLDEYVLPSKTVVDVITEDEGSLFRTLYALCAIPVGEQNHYLSNAISDEAFLASIKPKALRIGLSAAERTMFTENGIDLESDDVVITLEAIDEDDVKTTERADFFAKETALVENIYTLLNEAENQQQSQDESDSDTDDEDKNASETEEESKTESSTTTTEAEVKTEKTIKEIVEERQSSSGGDSDEK